MKVNIHNQCSNTKLISLVYFCNDAVCPKLSDQQIDIGTKMKACFEINATQDDFEGALLFKLQREESRSNIYLSNLFVQQKYSNDEAKCVRMLIAWKVRISKIFLYVSLVEHAKNFALNEEILKKLYSKNQNWIRRYNDIRSDTWIMDDDTVLKTTSSARDFKGILELSVSIFEGKKSGLDMRPLGVNFKR
jgi:hypothetical protein